MPGNRFIPTCELRKRVDALIQAVAESGEPCYITESGKAKAVLLDIHRYHALMDLIEEAESPSSPPKQHGKHVSVRHILATAK
jgi:PHD/YefM family antitoxin component YafN of YafNO toxin-antitoxin module